MEFKSLHFDISETKEELINGQKVGIIKGHAAAYSLDRVGDIILKGAFAKTLQDHILRGNRQIRMKFQHKRDEIIGGFPVHLAKEDDKGLYVEGHINLDVQRGREVFSLAKQGVLEDMSIAFYIPKDGSDYKTNSDGERRRFIKELDLREISIVDEPANIDAQITQVKSTLNALGVEYSISLNRENEENSNSKEQENVENLDTDDKNVIIKSDNFKKVEEDLKTLGLSRKQSKTIISRVKSIQRDAGEKSEEKPIMRDATIEKLNEILLVQELNNLTSKLMR